MKPKIALLTRINDQRYTVNLDYVNALQKAGADVVLIHPQSIDSLTDELSRCDGLCIPGGDDVNPNLYHEENIHSYPIDSSIEQLDLDSINIMVQQNKPILGICRGLQILNVAFGGTLYQDIPTQFNQTINHSYSPIHQQPLKGHCVNIINHTQLSKILPNQIEVNTYHHQGIKELSKYFTISAKSEDGLIEAIESKNIIAVQWHPERMTSIPVFQSLFNYFVNRTQHSQD